MKNYTLAELYEMAQSGSLSDIIKPTRAEWCLDSEQIEVLLYTHPTYNADDYARAMYDAENFTQYALNTWLCTDTYVGLRFICLNDRPIIISWQSARKADQEIMFFNNSCRDYFKEIWQRYDKGPELANNVLDPASFSLPIRLEKRQGDNFTYHVDRNRITLDHSSALRYITNIDGNLSADHIVDMSLLNIILEAIIDSQKSAQNFVQRMEEFRAKPNEGSYYATHPAEFEKAYRSAVERKDFYDVQVLPLLRDRIAIIKKENQHGRFEQNY